MSGREIVTAEDVRNVPPGGELSCSPGAIVTDWAREVAESRGVRIVQVTKAEEPVVVAIGGDHGGFPLKEQLKGELTRLGYRYLDMGTYSTDPVDYPDVALAVARAVRAGEARFGILVDGAGIGSAMAANKVPGVRAALVHDAFTAQAARAHNDANVVGFGARVVGPGVAAQALQIFRDTAFEGGRHAARVEKIKAIEERYAK